MLLVPVESNPLDAPETRSAIRFYLNHLTPSVSGELPEVTAVEAVPEAAFARSPQDRPERYPPPAVLHPAPARLALERGPQWQESQRVPDSVAAGNTPA
jgi:hypothetical protein